MRKTLLLILAGIISYASFGSSALTTPIDNKPLTSELMIPMFNSGKLISIDDYIKLTPKTYKLMTGQKLSFKQKLELYAGKKALKKMITKEGTLDIQKMKRYGLFGKFEWHWGGFALGLFLSILGPIVALFFNDDYKWDRFWTALHTSVWIFAIIGIIIAAAGGA
jgi:hypothetical protein